MIAWTLFIFAIGFLFGRVYERVDREHKRFKTK